MALNTSIFQNHQFLRLWGNQLLLQVAFNMSNYTALLILAHRLGSPFVQAQFYVALTIPAFIFGLIAGPVADMVNRKKIMLISDALMAILFLCYGFVIDSVMLIMAIAFLTSSVARFFIPAEAATIPLIVKDNTLHQANAFFLFTLLGSVLIGYTIAGPIIQIFGGLGTVGEIIPFIISSVMLFIGFFLRLSFKNVEAPIHSQGHIFKKTLSLFRETILETTSNKLIYIPILLLIFVELNIGILSVIFLEYVKRYIDIPLTSISYVLMIPFIGGLALGTYLLEFVTKSFGYKKPIFVSCLVIALVFILFGLTPLFAPVGVIRTVSVLFAFIIGICMVIIAVSSRTLLQTSAHQSMHGRVFSFMDIMIALVTPLPVLVLGFLASTVNILTMLSLYGILVLVTTTLYYKYFYARTS